MKLKKIVPILLACLLSLSIVACDKGTDSSTGSTDNNGPIIIGGIGPLTGELAQYGVPALNGAKLALDEAGSVLGREIEFVTLDDKGTMEDANNAYNKLVNNNNAIAIIGPVTSQPATSAAAKSQSDGIPLISPTGTALEVTAQGPNVFRACFIDPFQGEVMANFATSQGYTNVAILYNTGTDYSIGLKDGFIETFEANGGTIVALEGYAIGDVDFKSQLTKIAETKPEALFLPDYYQEVSLISKQIDEIGFENTVLLGADGWDGVLTTISDTAYIEGAFYCNHYSNQSTDPIVQNFLADYKTTYNSDSNSFAALGYDAGKILLAAIEKAGSTDKDEIIKALNETNITSVTGTIAFDENRNPIKSATILQIVDGKEELFTVMEPK